MNTTEAVSPRGRRLAVVTAITGTVFIAAGAFWLSFTALADLAQRSGIEAGQAWAWPLIVDGIIVVATVAVVALANQSRPTWYPWTLLAAGAVVSVTANAIHAIIAADTDVPAVLAASVAAIPPLVLLSITHLTVILTRPTTTPDADVIEEVPAETVVPSQAVAAPIWGLVTQHLGLRVAVLAAAVLVGISALLGLLLKVPESQHLDRAPMAYWGPAPVALEPDPDAGPIMVSIEYEVAAEQEADFLLAMDAMRRSRRRSGAGATRRG